LLGAVDAAGAVVEAGAVVAGAEVVGVDELQPTTNRAMMLMVRTAAISFLIIGYYLLNLINNI
jgi:hypothetical protein